MRPIVNFSRQHPYVFILVSLAILVTISFVTFSTIKTRTCHCPFSHSTIADRGFAHGSINRHIFSRHPTRSRFAETSVITTTTAPPKTTTTTTTATKIKQTQSTKYILTNPSLPSVSGRLVKLNSVIPRLSGTGYIYVHPFSDLVSNSIADSGYFEPIITRRFIALLKLHPEAQFIDFGANIGYYSLISAHMNRKSLAVEANPRNAAVLQKSILHNKFTESVSLLNMAVGLASNNFVSLATEVGNMGNTIVQENPKSSVVYDYNGKVNLNIRRTEFNKIKTITMSDLVERDMIRFRTAIVKMDIQGHELKALRSSEKFFSKIKVPAFFVEWVNFQQLHKKTEAKQLAEIFLRQGFKPYNPVTMTKLRPDANVAGSWTYDVLFLKNSPYVDLFT